MTIKKSIGNLERRPDGRQRHHLHGDRCAEQRSVRLQIRFENGPGTNPEELIGAAHAGCFSMALSLMLGEAGPEGRKDRDARGRHAGQGERRIRDHRQPPRGHREDPGADPAKFQEIANKAKAGCPVSKVLNAKITMNAKLEN